MTKGKRAESSAKPKATSAAESSARPKGKASAATAHDTSGGFGSMREAYDELGADGYYESHGADYRNPHETVLLEALSLGLTAVEDTGLLDASSRPLRVLDLACGSGEASIAIQRWAAERPERQAPSLVASDPYTFAAFEQRMGLDCQRWSFEDVAAGVLDDELPFDVCVAAFSLHLIDKSYFNPAMSALARACSLLLVATPHKRPHIAPADGWEEMLPETVHERVRVRFYSSLSASKPDAAAVAQAKARAAEATAAAAAAAAASAESSGEEGEEGEGEGEEEELDEEALMEELIEEIDAMNVGQLRSELAERNLDKGGKKNELAQRLLQARVAEAKEGVGSEEEEEEEEEEESEEEVEEEEARAAEARAVEEAERRAAKETAETERRAATERARAERVAADRAAKQAAREEKVAKEERRRLADSDQQTLAAVKKELEKAETEVRATD